jgi:hypothetical protein
LFVVLPLSVNASRIGEQFFEFLGRLGQLAFYIPQLSINVVAKFPDILPKYDVFIVFYIFSKRTNAFPNITMDIQRLN